MAKKKNATPETPFFVAFFSYSICSKRQSPFTFFILFFLCSFFVYYEVVVI